MSRKRRFDWRGAWHHVMNRGIARRTAFESRAEVRYFLALLAKEVRRGRLEIEGLCVLTTHFHLLVRSPIGELSLAMQDVENTYVRCFNRRHKRDGSLSRRRFNSRLVESALYLETPVRHIDHNPVEARLLSRPEHYPHGSVFHWHPGSQRPWMARYWIESVLGPLAKDETVPQAYAQMFGRKLTAAHASWTMRRVEQSVEGRTPSGIWPPLPLIKSEDGWTERRNWRRKRSKSLDGPSRRSFLSSSCQTRNRKDLRLGYRPCRSPRTVWCRERGTGTRLP